MPDAGRFETARFYPRAVADLLDGLVLYAIFVAIERVWLSSSFDPRTLYVMPSTPTTVVVLMAA